MRKIEHICERILGLAGGVPCEVTAEEREAALTRFADNVISQNVASSSLNVSVRLLDAGRSAKVNLNQADDATLKAALASAREILKRQKKDPHQPALPGPRRLPPAAGLYDADTAGLTPAFRAAKAAELARACRRTGQTAYGTVDNGWSRVTIANSRGVFAQHRESFVTHSVTVRDRDGFGWAEQPARAVGERDFAGLNERARAKAAAGRAPREVKPGRYTVVLEPAAAAGLVSYLGVYGFGGQLYNEGRSFASGALGKRVLSPLLTIEDNALDGPSAGMPFDFEGQPRSRVTLVENGVLKAVVHDRKTAKKAGAASTGHALPQPNYMGPIPLNLAVKPGQGTLEDLIKGTERGLLVTQFHYTNLLRPLTVEMTGMTRNGTFMIEDGRIAYPVKNLRFTQSMVEAFAGLEAVAAEKALVMEWGALSCPAVRLAGLNFSSSTKF